MWQLYLCGNCIYVAILMFSINPLVLAILVLFMYMCYIFLLDLIFVLRKEAL